MSVAQLAGSSAIGKLVVIGVGLIGGSFALALKKAGAVEARRRRRPHAQESRRGDRAAA